MITFIVSFLLLIVIAALIIGYKISTPRYSGELSDHFNGKSFFNLSGEKPRGFAGVLKWMLQREKGEWQVLDSPSIGDKPATRIIDGIRITFVNHSTFLIQTDELNILTDPIWSERSSPFSWAGPKRMRPPGLKFEDLPPIDLVVLSHNHYDHLDIPTLKRLFDNHKPRIIAPLGVKAYLDEEGVVTGLDLDWWNQVAITENTSVEIVPAQHFSGRGLFDRNATLWGGYVIKSPAGNLYFAGDTGYDQNTFREIGKRFAPLRAALLPIGAYKPIWFMSPVHITPEQAVKTHLDLQTEISIAMHYGTFPLGDDGQNEPVRDLQEALKKYQIPDSQFRILKEGSYFEIASLRAILM